MKWIKKMLSEYKIAYIHASKVSRLVSLLIPGDCWKAMKILADPEIRKHADINKNNKFVFPSSKYSSTHVNGWICVYKVCKKAGLGRHVTATDMRHYWSTNYALQDVSASERELFYKHLGYSSSMNEHVYQAPPAIRTITTVGKFMSFLEGNRG
jgi:integrase